MAKRGHSNVEAKKTRPWNEVDKDSDPGIARIPLGGGVSPSGWKELPPLSLRQDEWEEIGRKMGWLPAVPETKKGKRQLTLNEELELVVDGEVVASLSPMSEPPGVALDWKGERDVKADAEDVSGKHGPSPECVTVTLYIDGLTKELREETLVGS